MSLQRSSRSRVLAITLGLVLVGIGTWLPWIRVNHYRSVESVPVPLLPHMHAGFEWGSGLILIPMALLVAIAVVRSSPIQRYLLVTGAGLWAVVLPLHYFRELSLVGFQSAYTPWIGWYLTIAGGLLLAFVGGVTAVRQWRVIQNRSDGLATDQTSQPPNTKEPPTSP